MMERPVPDGWESRPSLYPVGGLGDGAVLRDALQRIADRVDGLDSGDPKTERRYEAFVFAYDAEAWRRGAADQLYSCALTGAAVLDCLGAEGVASDSPYAGRIGRAVTDLKRLGLELQAWVDTTVPGAELPSGPFVGLVGDNGKEGPEHVLVGLDGLDHDGECYAVEGGQLSKHGKGYRIDKAVYDFETRSQGQVWGRRLAPSVSAWRRLRGYVDLEACVFSQRCVLPVREE